MTATTDQTAGGAVRSNGKARAGNRNDPATTPSDQQPRPDKRNGKIRYAKLWITEMRGRFSSLSPAARGAYISTLLEYLTQQHPLPDDEKVLRRICGVDHCDWAEVRAELLTVFDLVDGDLHDEYADRCIAEFRTASNRNKGNAKTRYAVIDGLRDVDQ